MKKITLLFLGIASFSSIVFSQATGKVALSKGQKLLVTNKVNSTIAQEIMGTTMEIKADLNSISALEVKDLNDTKFDLANTINHLDMNISMMGKEMKYDSDKKEDREGDMGQQMGEYVNKPTNIALARNGKIIKETTEKSKTDMMTGIAGDPKNAFETAFLAIPTDAKTGFSWTDSSAEGITKKTTTYTIREIKDNDAVIDIKGNMVSNGVNEIQGNQVTVNTTGTITGETTVNMVTGIVKNHAVTIDSKGTSEIMGQEIPVSSNIISKTVVTESK